MQSCPKCNSQVADTNTFCPTCGTKIAVPVQAQASNSKLHCPVCKSENYTTTTEQSTENGAFITYVCNDCTTKFHNMQSVKEAAEKNQKNSKIALVVFSATGILMALLIILGLVFDSIFGIAISALVVSPFFIVFFCYYFVYKNRAKKFESELAYLKENCFN